MSVKEALEGLEVALVAIKRLAPKGALVLFAIDHLSTIREWVEYAEQLTDDLRKICDEKDAEIARLHSTLEEARRLVDEAISAGNHGRLDLIRVEACRYILKITERQNFQRGLALEEARDRFVILRATKASHEKKDKIAIEGEKAIDTALSRKGEGEEGELTAAEIGRRGSITWKCTKCGVTTSISRGATCEKICGCCQAPPDSPPDPVCTHCDDTRRVETECGTIICPMCKPCECGGSGEVYPGPCPDCGSQLTETAAYSWCESCKRPFGQIPRPCPKGCKPEGGATEKARAILEAAKRGAKVTVVIPPDKKGGGE